MPRLATTNPIARLAALCDESGLSRSEIARRAGWNPATGTLSRLLSGDRDPSLSSVARVLAALGCQWADLDG